MLHSCGGGLVQFACSMVTHQFRVYLDSMTVYHHLISQQITHTHNKQVDKIHYIDICKNTPPFDLYTVRFLEI